MGPPHLSTLRGTGPNPTKGRLRGTARQAPLQGQSHSKCGERPSPTLLVGFGQRSHARSPTLAGTQYPIPLMFVGLPQSSRHGALSAGTAARADGVARQTWGETKHPSTPLTGSKAGLQTDHSTKIVLSRPSLNGQATRITHSRECSLSCQASRGRQIDHLRLGPEGSISGANQARPKQSLADF